MLKMLLVMVQHLFKLFKISSFLWLWWKLSRNQYLISKNCLRPKCFYIQQYWASKILNLLSFFNIADFTWSSSILSYITGCTHSSSSDIRPSSSVIFEVGHFSWRTYNILSSNRRITLFVNIFITPMDDFNGRSLVRLKK